MSVRIQVTLAPSGGAPSVPRTVVAEAYGPDSIQASQTGRALGASLLRLLGATGVDEAATRVTAAVPAEPAPCAYVFARAGQVRALPLPVRIDGHPGERLGEVLEGCRPPEVLGVVLDCAALGYINTGGLTALVTHARRLPVHLHSVAGIRTVLEVVGLLRVLHVHADLAAALAGLERQVAAGAAG